MRIVQLIARLNVGGPARLVDALARDLSDDQDVQVWTGRAGRGEAEHHDLHGCVSAPLRRVPGLRPELRPHDDARAAAWLAAELRRHRPDIVHSHTAKAGLLARGPGLAPRGVARVHTFHGHVLDGYFSPRMSEAVRRTERQLARRSAALVAVSARVRDQLLDAGVGEPHQYVVIPPGAELPPLPGRGEARARLGLAEARNVVVYTGRLTDIKRPDRLVALAEALSRSRPGTVLLVAGGGDRAEEVYAAARRLPTGALLPLGWRADLATIYAAADVLVLTSDNEGTPVSVIEAQLAGLPVVATPVGGVPDLVDDGVNGLLAAPGEVFHEAVTALLDDSTRRAALGARAAERAQRYGIAPMVTAHRRLYERLTSG